MIPLPIYWTAIRAIPWRMIGAILLVFVVAFAGQRVVTWRAGWLEYKAAVTKAGHLEQRLQAEVDCRPGSACAERAVRLAADGAEAVQAARLAAQEAAQREQARRDAEARAAVQRATAAASAATVRLRAAEARLRKAIASDATCAAQAREPIRCDL